MVRGVLGWRWARWRAEQDRMPSVVERRCT